jgi:hypothetical protein
MTNSKRWPKTTLGVAPQGEQWAFVAGALGLVVRLPHAPRHRRPANDHVRSEKNCVMVGFQIAWRDDWCSGVTLSPDFPDVTP